MSLQPSSLHPISAETLLTHAACLRSLARALLSDVHAAEDVLQDTWLTALERPPHSQDRLGGWLHRVTQGLALKKRRSEGRRAQREECVAREEGVASVVDVLEQREALKGVVEAVLALDEPYQSAIMMRYYQDLPPREIAALLDVPLATVESRLHRGRQQLRDRLDREIGGRKTWMPALALATGLEQEPGVALAVSGATLGGIKMVSIFGLCTALAATLWWVTGSQAETAGSTAGTEGRMAAAEAAALGGVLAAPDDQEDARAGSGRRPVTSPDGESPSGNPLERAPYEYTLEGLVVDERDLPVDGAHLFLAPLQQPLNDCGEVAADGTFRLSFRGDLTSLPIALYASKNGFQHGLARVDLHGGETTFVRILVSRTPSKLPPSERERAEQLAAHLKQQGYGNPETIARLRQHEKRLQELFTPSRSALPGPRIGSQHVGGDAIRFRWPTGAAIEREERELKGRDEARQMREVELQQQKQQQALRELAERKRAVERVRATKLPAPKLPGEHEAGAVHVFGVIYDAGGEPASRATVLLHDARRRWSATTDADGRFELGLDPQQFLELRAGGGEFGLATIRFEPTEAGFSRELHWEASLDRGREVSGRLLDEAGTPIGDWIVEARTRSGSSIAYDLTKSTVLDGSFGLPNLDGNSATLFLRRLEATPFAVHIVPNVLADVPVEVTLASQASELASALVSIVDETGAPVRGADVRLWQESSGRGAWLRQVDEHYELAGIPPGDYRLVAGSFTRGFVDAGTLHIDTGEEPCDLGTITLPTPGRLIWAELDAAEGIHWLLYRKTEGTQTLVAQGTLNEPFADALAAGEYSLVLSGEDLAVPPLQAVVRPGEQTTLELPNVVRR